MSKISITKEELQQMIKQEVREFLPELLDHWMPPFNVPKWLAETLPEAVEQYWVDNLVEKLNAELAGIQSQIEDMKEGGIDVV